MVPELFREDIVLSLVNGKKILHIGCADFPFHKEKFEKGTLFHQKLMKECDLVIGLDNNKDAINYLRGSGLETVYYGDIFENKYDIDNFYQYHFDYILLGEVLEHLDNPGLCLKNLLKMNLGAKIIITTPNAFSLSSLINIYARGGYEHKTHPDHCFWPSKKTAIQLFKRNNLKVSFFSYAYWGLYKEYSLFRRIMHKLMLNRFEYLAGTLIFIVEPDD